MVRVHKVWAVIRREFVERVRTRWFWISAILGPVLFAGIIVFQIMQSVGGAVRHIAVVDSTAPEYGARVVAGLGASKLIRATRVAPGPGVVDSLTRLVEDSVTNRVLELTPEGPVPYGGGYTEYVARTGRELERKAIVAAFRERAGTDAPQLRDDVVGRVGLTSRSCCTSGTRFGGEHHYVRSCLRSSVVNGGAS